jgi:hypothetical protein
MTNYINIIDLENEKFVLCDTPGIFDTNGPMNEIAN